MSNVQEALKNTLVMLDALTVEFGITGLEPLIAECKSALSEIEKCEPLTDTYVQVVPDKCDRIVYKNRYYHLDQITSPQPIEKCEPVGETVETLEHWLSINMPAGTVIGDPLWWARKIRNVIAYTSHQPIEKREPKPEYKLSSDGKSVVFVNYRELVDIENDKLNKRHTAPQPIEKCEPVTDTYVQLVPDKCDKYQPKAGKE